jgi:hypothetical protein
MRTLQRFQCGHAEHSAHAAKALQVFFAQHLVIISV